MDGIVEKIISDIVDALGPSDMFVQNRFFLTQSLLSLARASHSAGYKSGCQDVINELNKQLDTSGSLEADNFVKYVMENSKKQLDS